MSIGSSSPHLFHRLMARVSGSRPGAWLFSQGLHVVDRFLLRVTDGKVSAPRLLVGLPTILLTTTGARTGLERTLPLIGMPDGDRIIVMASNWGGTRHPAWYHNLRANPLCHVARDGASRQYRARELVGEERERMWIKQRRLPLPVVPLPTNRKATVELRM